MTVRLAHLADLHFGEDAPGVAEALAADIRAHAPHAVVVSGDLTRRAASSELAAAFAFLATFGVPVLAVPGNHDIPARDLWARLFYPRRTWHAGGPPPSELLVHGIALVGLDTVTRGQWHLDWSAGAISPRRLARLADRLAAYRAPSVVVCHHPLVHPPGMAGREPPRGAEATRELLSRMGVRAVLCGHLHRAGAQPLGTPWPVQLMAPSALSPRGSAMANGWNLVEIGPTDLRARARQFIAGTWTERELVSPAG